MAQQENSSSSTSGGLQFNAEVTLDKALYCTGRFASGAGDVLSYMPFYGILTKKINEADGGASSIGYDSDVYTAGKATGISLGIVDLVAGGATGAALADRKTGSLFRRGTSTCFNGRADGGSARFGWGWNQNIGTSGSDIIRLGIGAARGTSWWSHITFWIVK